MLGRRRTSLMHVSFWAIEMVAASAARCSVCCISLYVRDLVPDKYVPFCLCHAALFDSIPALLCRCSVLLRGSNEMAGTGGKSTGAYDYLIKLMLIGDSGVGKSSLLLRFSDDSFGLGSCLVYRHSSPLSSPFVSLFPPAPLLARLHAIRVK